MSDAPSNLPADPAKFFHPSVDLNTITLSPQPEPKHVLEQLGPPPFRKTAFPLMGFLASLYEHVAAHVAGGSSSEQ